MLFIRCLPFVYTSNALLQKLFLISKAYPSEINGTTRNVKKQLQHCLQNKRCSKANLYLKFLEETKRREMPYQTKKRKKVEQERCSKISQIA